MSRTSLQNIARAAGVTRGAIYWHFADKAHLFDAMLKRVTLPLEQAIHRSGDPQLTDPVAHVRKSFTEALRRTVDDPQARRVFEIATQKVEYVDELQVVRVRRLQGRNQRIAAGRARLCIGDAPRRSRARRAGRAPRRSACMR